MNYLKGVDKFHKMMWALITVMGVILIFYITVTNVYSRYLSHHYVAFNESKSSKTIDDWNRYASQGHVLHLVLYDDKKASNKYQKQIVSYMTAKSNEDDVHYKPLTVDMSDRKNHMWVNDMNIKGVNTNQRYPIILTFTKDDQDQTHIDVAKIKPNTSPEQLELILKRYK